MLSTTDAAAAASSVGISEQLAALSVFRVLLKDAPVARELAGTLLTLLSPQANLSARLRELVIMRIGWRTGSVYEWAQHWRVAPNLQILEADLLAVRAWPGSSSIAAAYCAVRRATDEALESGSITEATWRECCRHLATDAERIELVIAIGNWTMFSQLLKSLAIPLEEGVAAWPPDGLAPQ